MLADSERVLRSGRLSYGAVNARRQQCCYGKHAKQYSNFAVHDRPSLQRKYSTGISMRSVKRRCRQQRSVRRLARAEM
jgi:hypothetical protein